jgi:predicted transcriptional regulator
MSELLNDTVIKDFVDSYSLLSDSHEVFHTAQEGMEERLPQYVRRIRTMAHNTTQQGLADAVGVDHSYISKIESGATTASMVFLDRLAEFVITWGEDA